MSNRLKISKGLKENLQNTNIDLSKYKTKDFESNPILMIHEADYTVQHIPYVRVIRKIGYKIIDFLAWVEDHQKRLFEKKKFIIRAEYCITMDRVPEELWDEVLQNKDQLDEWRHLYGIDPQPTKDFLREHPYLVVDTCHFSEDFKWCLLAHFDDLDNALDGLLIKSENFQALNTILPKFRNKVQIIYIDPPFNKEQDADYHYSVKYKDATWITMLENRVRLGKEMLNEKGAIFVRCDYNGNMYVRLLMNEVYGSAQFRNELIISRTRAKQLVENQFIQQTENLFFYSKADAPLIQVVERKRNPEWHQLLHFPRPDCKPRIVLGREFYPPKGRRWALSQERIDQYEKKERLE